MESEAESGTLHSSLYEGLVRRFFADHEDGGNWLSIRELMAVDVVRVCPRLTATGVDQVERASMDDVKAFRDFKVEISHLMKDGSCAAARVIIHGVHTHHYGKIKPMNRRLALPAMYFFEFEHSLISRLEVYYDLQLLVSQLNTGETIFLR